MAIRVVERIVWARDDFKSTAVVAEAVAKWADAIVNSPAKRLVARYFFMSADGPQFPVPVKQIFRYPTAAATDLNTFCRHAKEIVGAMVGNSELVVLEPFGTPHKKHHHGNKVSVVCYEVSPFFAEGDPRQATTTKVFDKHNNITKFQFASRVTDHEAVSSIAKTAITKLQAQQQSAAAKNLNVHSQNLKVVVHEVERAFPTMTVAVNVRVSEENTLDPVATAVETIQQQTEMMRHANTMVDAAQETAMLYAALTPLDVKPAGYYFKEVVRVHSDHANVRDEVAEYLNVIKARLQKCPDGAAKAPERYAAVMKGIVDIECAVAEAAAVAAEAEADDDAVAVDA
jgi:hypothetical protein